MRQATDGLDGAVGDAAFVLSLREKGMRDTAVLRAMEQVSRTDFAPAEFRALARRDLALPLPCGTSMTAPGTVAAMLSRLQVAPGHRVLEIGTGSGYVTALLARLGAGAVVSLERSPTLAAAAADRLAGLAAVRVTQADGLAADLPEGEFDRVLVNGSVEGFLARWRAALAHDARLVAVLAHGGEHRIVAVTARTGLEIGPPARLAPLIPGMARVL